MPKGIESQITRHQIQLQRLAGGNYRKIVPVLKKMVRDIQIELTRVMPAKVESIDPQFIKNMQVAEAQTRAIIKSAVSGMDDILEPEFNDLLLYETQYMATIYSAAVNVELSGVTAEAIKAAVSNKKMVLTDYKGRVTKTTISSAVKQFEKALNRDVKEGTKRTLQMIRGGFITGETNKDIAKKIAQSIDPVIKRQAEALVRTSTNHIGSIARQEFYKANDRVLKGEKFLATLDNRTSLICASNDGKIFPIGEGPIPPLHWNCRSVRVAEVKDVFKIPGLAETRASVDGPVNERVTYGGFLKRQSKEFQNDVLGPERAKLFRSGKISIGKFTDNGRVLSLEELKRIES